jgi:hypothetical protein
MSIADTMMPLLTAPWLWRFGGPLPTCALPGLRPEALAHLEAHWTGILTPEMRQLLHASCGLSQTPLGDVDFTGRWFPEEPLSVFRPSLTLAIDDQGRRWIAEVGKRRGLPGPVWCVYPQPEVAMLVDRSLADFILRLYSTERRKSISMWTTGLSVRARKLWASRHAAAIALPVAFSRMRELRGWLAALPLDAWIYDLRTLGPRHGLPYGISRERGDAYRCGRLPVFAFVGILDRGALARDHRLACGASWEGSWSSPPAHDLMQLMVSDCK